MYLIKFNHFLEDGSISEESLGTGPVWSCIEQYTNGLQHSGYQLWWLAKHTDLRYITFVQGIQSLPKRGVN